MVFVIYNDATCYPFLRVLVLESEFQGMLPNGDYQGLQGRLVREKLLESRSLSQVPRIRLPMRIEGLIQLWNQGQNTSLRLIP